MESPCSESDMECVGSVATEAWLDVLIGIEGKLLLVCRGVNLL